MDPLPAYDPKIEYKSLYWKTYMMNELLLKDMKSELENVYHTNNHSDDNIVKSSEDAIGTSARKRHIRRTAKEINKNEVCPYKDCGKKYGSEGSLNLHMKLKHASGNKTDREKLAVGFWYF